MAKFSVTAVVGTSHDGAWRGLLEVLSTAAGAVRVEREFEALWQQIRASRVSRKRKKKGRRSPSTKRRRQELSSLEDTTTPKKTTPSPATPKSAKKTTPPQKKTPPPRKPRKKTTPPLKTSPARTPPAKKTTPESTKKKVGGATAPSPPVVARERRKASTYAWPIYLPTLAARERLSRNALGGWSTRPDDVFSTRSGAVDDDLTEAETDALSTGSLDDWIVADDAAAVALSRGDEEDDVSSCNRFAVRGAALLRELRERPSALLAEPDPPRPPPDDDDDDDTEASERGPSFFSSGAWGSSTTTWGGASRRSSVLKQPPRSDFLPRPPSPRVGVAPRVVVPTVVSSSSFSSSASSSFPPQTRVSIQDQWERDFESNCGRSCSSAYLRECGGNVV